MSKLSPQAQKIIKDYLVLPFPDHAISAPYFNNQRVKMRAALRVLIGKGSSQDIVEEAQIISLRDKIDLEKLNNTDLKKFLVEHNLGVDCSALAYYILDAENQARGLGLLKKQIIFTNAKNPFRKILAKLRPVENISVAVLADDKNSKIVTLDTIQAGDLIILWRTGKDHKLNHILIVHQVDGNKISYVHSFRWSKDGLYDHGVQQGTVTISDKSKSLAEQIWEEKNKIGEENETWRHVQLAEPVEIRRLNAF
ncbi:MAG: hypothetical protein A2821_00315 [Candidatus Magasanikbacteria bacterium RIFCSPHIGHO2_01_FULL_41_23]|uniref:Uncharacterized protein n=1 Tax=Candidatus Magasanikbacteria bacterium RIFCSPLOWO2_01_FULL_40_15 TaxID=1798686 RepID=A0A1F6N053_9BACT|nr:MAG: hypothetical protein A2821_00315 [Candidatus Magasanikbacteria bacterium RIFCSPHIGHO2_01_FULL_41_23]OGH74622.1 MAG: hypothetical protein A3F22_01670 [Candidatus Magasanikbacteria bacterium RIFCSPHIGHO2_12_FULL_41_16]OGH77335.1 MAG: hypothetical protein A2983_01370 [Candidatus Magasanikbacteria bacterium RIFCSPLOWO2_01_FULL_40_15]